MPLTPDQLNDLGRWPYVCFGDLAARDAAIERYQRFLERQRAEALKAWFTGSDSVVQP